MQYHDMPYVSEDEIRALKSVLYRGAYTTYLPADSWIRQAYQAALAVRSANSKGNGHEVRSD